MSLEESHSIITKEGHQYKIGFSSFDSLVLPNTITKTVVEIVIAITDNKGINNASTLFSFSKLIKSYLKEKDVILYCYCDNKEIVRSNKHQQLSPQEFRSLLFQKMFDKESNSEFINKPIELIDANNEKHCIHLFSSIENTEHIEVLAGEIYKMQK